MTSGVLRAFGAMTIGAAAGYIVHQQQQEQQGQTSETQNALQAKPVNELTTEEIYKELGSIQGLRTKNLLMLPEAKSKSQHPIWLLKKRALFTDCNDAGQLEKIQRCEALRALLLQDAKLIAAEERIDEYRIQGCSSSMIETEEREIVDLRKERGRRHSIEFLFRA